MDRLHFIGGHQQPRNKVLQAVNPGWGNLFRGVLLERRRATECCGINKKHTAAPKLPITGRSTTWIRNTCPKQLQHPAFSQWLARSGQALRKRLAHATPTHQPLFSLLDSAASPSRNKIPHRQNHGIGSVGILADTMIRAKR